MQDDQLYITRIIESGSEAALYSLVRKYEKQVFNLCFRILRNREEAEEIAHDAFMKSFEELKKLEDQTKYGGWLLRIAYNKSIDFTRKKKVNLVSTDGNAVLSLKDDFYDTPETALDKKDQKEWIESLLAQLPEVENSLITLFYLNGYGIKEVAEITNLTESNVKIKLMRCRELLKAKIERKFKSETENLY
jgi:RNA polymerase sigma-70 factor, ECF subfamily